MPEQLIAMLEGLIEQLKAHPPYEDQPASSYRGGKDKPMDMCLIMVTGKPMHGKGAGLLPPPLEEKQKAVPQKKRRAPSRITQGKARMPHEEPHDDDDDDDEEDE